MPESRRSQKHVVYVGVVGSRRRATRHDYTIVIGIVEDVLKRYYREMEEDRLVLVSGGCGTGADSYVEVEAKEHGVPMLAYNANWRKHPRVAGFIRNSTVASVVSELHALVAEDRTGGTEDTIKKALKLDKTVYLYLADGTVEVV